MIDVLQKVQSTNLEDSVSFLRSASSIIAFIAKEKNIVLQVSVQIPKKI